MSYLSYEDGNLLEELHNSLSKEVYDLETEIIELAEQLEAKRKQLKHKSLAETFDTGVWAIREVLNGRELYKTRARVRVIVYEKRVNDPDPSFTNNLGFTGP